ncbi:WD40-repeat-containing domain protein [Halteromyces radiatus]|uniref:WD40-repeat-containing domain protein n=1 Tax=Halteromyces radiatus TaxID=101107 RepID=UPI002220955C|nr:WD40-repeat-containing domain protein [Halteromyces radiatus]KAI8099614.1 WD40-repeat-containing domain protein [Halteromyces radiatus]
MTESKTDMKQENETNLNQDTKELMKQDTNEKLETPSTTDDSSSTPKRKGRPSKKAATDDVEGTTRGRKKKMTTNKSTPKSKTVSKATKVKSKMGCQLERMKELTERYPDKFWQYHADSGHAMIDAINENHVLEPVQCNISDQGAITGLTLSPNGLLLATFSTIGSIKIWDIGNDLRMVRKLRDADEPNIDEFYCGQFVADAPEIVVAAGKLKDRHQWSSEDEDNHILPCPIKIFNMETGKVIAKLEGHDEEILCIKALRFNGENYYISTSQDGHIIKWRMADDWITLLDWKKMEDEETCMAFTVSFLPNAGNKYFLAACDEHLRLYDFEHGKLIQTFENLYSSYCDCGKFINWLDESSYWDTLKETASTKASRQQQQYAWFISRGAELCDESGGITSPNTCTLHRLVYPNEEDGLFTLEEIRRYKHEDYIANSWLVKVASNGRYMLAPTMYGQVFVFNLLSGQLTAILKHHEDMEIRDVVFHPYAPLMFSSGDDGAVKVYSYKSDDAQQEDQEMKEADTSRTTEQSADDKMHKDLDVGAPSST